MIPTDSVAGRPAPSTATTGSGLREVTVSPTAIDAFARFLDGHVADEVARLRGLTQTAGERDGFGSYDLSETAQRRYRDASAAQVEALTQLHAMAGQLAEATRSVAGSYQAVEETNATGGSSVGSMLV